VQNLTELLLTRAAQYPQLKLGVIDNQQTLPSMLARAAGGAQEIRRTIGDGNDHRIALVASTSTDYLVSWMACVLAEVPVALINPTYPSQLLGQMLERLAPSLVITDLPEQGWTGNAPVWKVSASTQWADADPSTSRGRTADHYSLASFMHTSGTTGVPKFCGQTHSYFLGLGAAVAENLGLVEGDRVLAPLPLFHINPMGYGIIGALIAGADGLTVTKFSASRFWPTVLDNEITALVMHSPPVQILKRATTPADAAGHKIRTMYWADRELMRDFAIPRAISGYGSTEAAGVSHLRIWSVDDDIPDNASCYGGLPRKGLEDHIDADGQILVRETEPGTLFSGYLTDGVLRPATNDENWFETADYGRRSDDGDLVFVERAAESIRVRGEFVPIPYVEERLGTIPELTDLALWRKRDEMVDDEVVLFVTASEVPIERIRSVAEELPAFMRPRHVAQIDRIPRDAGAGKVQRRLLDDQVVLSWTTLG
jgi:carnitine-CoA ligase